MEGDVKNQLALSTPQYYASTTATNFRLNPDLGMNLPCASNEANYLRSLVSGLSNQSPLIMDLIREPSSL